jgi:hypothetical protein
MVLWRSPEFAVACREGLNDSSWCGRRRARTLGFQPLSADMISILPISRPTESTLALVLLDANLRTTAIQNLSGTGSASDAFTTEGR